MNVEHSLGEEGGEGNLWQLKDTTPGKDTGRAQGEVLAPGKTRTEEFRRQQRIIFCGGRTMMVGYGRQAEEKHHMHREQREICNRAEDGMERGGNLGLWGPRANLWWQPKHGEIKCQQDCVHSRR
jgi:hypothetical protein